MTRLSEEELKKLEELVEYRSERGLCFVIENHEWDGPMLTIKVKGTPSIREDPKGTFWLEWTLESGTKYGELLSKGKVRGSDAVN